MNTSAVNMSAEALEKMIAEINDARLKEKKAVSLHAGVAQAREVAKNLMYNYWPQISEMITDYQRIREENESLAADIASQDKELAEAKKKLAALQEKATKK